MRSYTQFKRQSYKKFLKKTRKQKNFYFVEKKFGGYQNFLYLCRVKLNQK